MPKTNKNMFWLEMLFFTVFFVVLFSFFNCERNKLPKIEVGRYELVDHEIKQIGAPSKLVVSEDGIALFYENSDYAAIYSLDGEFLYGVLVDSSNRGTGNMGYVDGKWVIDSKNNTLYIFHDKNQIEVYQVTVNENLELFRELQPKMGEYKSLVYTYLGKEYKYSSIEKAIVVVNSGEETVVIKLE